MKIRSLSRLSLLVLLDVPLTSWAHDSLEAMQQGGSLLKMTAALLHPLLETPYWPVLLLVSLAVAALAGAITYWRRSYHAGFGMRAQPVRVADRRYRK